MNYELEIRLLNSRLDTMFDLIKHECEKNDKQFKSLWESIPLDLDDGKSDLGCFKGRPIC